MRTEWFPLVNEEGETIGKATRKECHSGSKLLHPVIHLHIFNKDGSISTKTFHEQGYTTGKMGHGRRWAY